MEGIEVFKTDIDNSSVAQKILNEIRRKFPGSDPSIDLSDCDNVLRVKYSALESEELKVGEILGQHGYNIEPLP